MKRDMLSIITTLVVIYVAVVALAYFFQERLLYFPLRGIAVTPASRGLTYENVSIETEDGLKCVFGKRFSRNPEDKLSRTVTSCPALSKSFTICDPIYPAPPMTNNFIAVSQANRHAASTLCAT